MIVNYAYAMSQPQGTGGSPLGALISFVPIIAMFVIFYFLLIRPQQKKQREHKEMLNNLKEGDNIITTCGMYGTIIKIKDDIFTLQLAENVKIKMARHGIAGLKQQ